MPADMHVTLHTLVYASHRAGIPELEKIGGQICAFYGKEIAKKAETDASCVNEIIRNNINITMPDEGKKVERLIGFATEEGIKYHPSEKSLTVRE